MRLDRVFGSPLILAAMMLTSCARCQLDPAYMGPTKRTTEILEYYGYPRRPIEAKVETIRERRRYTIKRVEFPSAVNVFGTENIKVDYYVQKGQGKFPTVLVPPVGDGVDFLGRNFARHFASNGFNCALVHNREVDLDEIESAEQVEDYLRQVVIDSRQVLDYLVQQDEVDGGKLGCLGISLGGIKATVVSAADERIKCTVIGLAGGSMADIALESKEKTVREYMARWFEMGVSPEALRIEMSDKIATDPVALAEYVDARNVLMYIAAFDWIIPRECCDNLREAMGKPEAVYLCSGHFTSLLYLPYAERSSLSFFRKKLATQ